MPKVSSVVNQYRGVNAHAHSFWQVERKWNRFHNAFTTELMRAVKAQARLLGYAVNLEDSIQIRRIGDDIKQPKADVIVRDPVAIHRAGTLPAAIAGAAIATLPEVLSPINTEKPYLAVAIRERTDSVEDGPIVAWIELLSPTNKGKGDDAGAYRAKRDLLLSEHVVFVEIDLLHQTPPTLDYFADYSPRKSHGESAHPYRIIVFDPRPSFSKGLVFAREFDVDEPLPCLIIPLNGGDFLDFDFDVPYQQNFKSSFYGDTIDYSTLPLKFNSYRPADQARIARRMLSVLRAAAQGQLLEDGPFPLDDMPLEQALAEIEALGISIA
jgi:hypothetical protein